MEKYFLIATIATIIFYTIYHFFLRHEACHQFNRFYLLSALVVSLILPFVRFSIPTPMPTSAAKPVSNFSEFITYIQLPESTLITNTVSDWNMSHLFLWIYILGVLFFTILFFIKVIKIGSVIVQSKKYREGKFIFVQYEKMLSPFSFFNYIFINKNAYNKEDSDRMVLHEQIHVQKRHSWDLIFVELVGIVFWFNPILLLYKRSLQIIHEYMADHCVLQQGIEPGAYLNLLLRQLTLPNAWMLGHHFNYLLTKNRFKMLKNHHYSKWAFAKAIYVLPLIALLIMFNCKPKSQPTETIYLELQKSGSDSETEGEVTYDIEINQDGQNKTEVIVKEAEDSLPFVQEMPEPIGGMESMYKFLSETIKYPENARNEGISGQVFVEFVVEKDGSISNVKVLKSVHPDLDAEAVRAVKLMPKWKPGKQKGEPVRCFYRIPVRFSIS